MRSLVSLSILASLLTLASSSTTPKNSTESFTMATCGFWDDIMGIGLMNRTVNLLYHRIAIPAGGPIAPDIIVNLTVPNDPWIPHFSEYWDGHIREFPIPGTGPDPSKGSLFHVEIMPEAFRCAMGSRTAAGCEGDDFGMRRVGNATFEGREFPCWQYKWSQNVWVPESISKPKEAVRGTCVGSYRCANYQHD